MSKKEVSLGLTARKTIGHPAEGLDRCPEESLRNRGSFFPVVLRSLQGHHPLTAIMRGSNSTGDRWGEEIN